MDRVRATRSTTLISLATIANYRTLKAAAAFKQLEMLENLDSPRN
jgi:hypothetical protein